MNFLKGVGGFVASIAALALLWVLAASLISGVGYVSGYAFPYMAIVADLAAVVCIFILLPMALFHRSRRAAGTGFIFSSYVFGLLTWMMGLLITLHYWGPVAVLIGLAFFGVGVVPIGMLAAAIKTEWLEVGLLFGGIVFTYGARAFGIWMGVKYEAGEERRQYKIIEATAAPLKKEWYYASAGQSVGPIDIEELKYLLSTRAEGLATMVWRDGFSGWKAANTVAELA